MWGKARMCRGLKSVKRKFSLTRGLREEKKRVREEKKCFKRRGYSLHASEQESSNKKSRWWKGKRGTRWDTEKISFGKERVEKGRIERGKKTRRKKSKLEESSRGNSNIREMKKDVKRLKTDSCPWEQFRFKRREGKSLFVLQEPPWAPSKQIQKSETGRKKARF